MSSPSRPPRSATGRRLALALALLASSGACGRFRSGPATEDATVVFANQSLDVADVYAVLSGSQAVRIGSVMPGQTEALRVPGDIASRSPFNIVARIMARSLALNSGSVTLLGGDQLHVTLPIDERILTVLP